MMNGSVRNAIGTGTVDKKKPPNTTNVNPASVAESTIASTTFALDPLLHSGLPPHMIRGVMTIIAAASPCHHVHALTRTFDHDSALLSAREKTTMAAANVELTA